VHYAFVLKEASAMRASNRDRKKELFWRRVIRTQPGSGMSVRAWCRKHSLRESSFYWWRRQLARRDAHGPAFVPVRVTADQSETNAFDLSAGSGALSRIEIVLPARRRVRLLGPVDRQTLTDVLAVLTSVKFNDAEAASC
jgi:transposase-like protein